MKHLIPDTVFDQHVIVLGKTRSGKSSVMRLMVEHLLDQGHAACIVDPKGDWWGLKASANGKQAGYPVVIFGGDHADVPLNSRSGAAVAELVATGNRSCIIDLGGWMPGARTEFWIDFSSSFFRMHRGRHYLVVDEVHNFCPKGKIMDPNSGKMLHWSNRLASEGLGKGISLLAASQRPQKVHNDFLTSCETLVAMRVIHKADRNAFEDWIDGCGDPEKGPEVVNSLAALKRGEAWVWSPEAEFGPKKIQFPMFATYDSFKAQSSVVPAKLKGWADVDLVEVTKKLEAVVKEAEANDPKKLQARIRELERQKVQVKSPVSIPTISSKTEREVRQLKQALKDAMNIIVKIETIGFEKGGVLPEEEMHKLMERIGEQISHMVDTKLSARKAQLENLQREAKRTLSRMKQIMEGDVTVQIAARRNEPVSIEMPRLRPAPQSSGIVSDGNLSVGEKACLTAAAQYDGGVERNQLSILTGYKRSTRDAYVLRLKNKGFIQDRGDKILATTEGISALGSFERLPEGPELQDYWRGKLPQGEKKIFEFLLPHKTNPVDRESITDATGYQRSTRDAYIMRMGAKKLVEQAGPGQVKLASFLF